MSTERRLSPSEHSNRSWRIHEYAADFTLIDAWVLPATGRRDEFADLYQIVVSLEPGADPGSASSRKLFAIRAWLGSRMGWDNPDVVNKLPIPGCNQSSLRERLPPELAATGGRMTERSNFRTVFEIENEAAFEVSNSLLHAIFHLGWVPQTDGVYRGQMGVYVKHRGRAGPAYMAAIAPFRHHIVYPALLRRIESAWNTRTTAPIRT